MVFSDKIQLPQKKLEIFIFIILLEVAAFFKASLYASTTGIYNISQWKLLTWLISYDFGFIKRGLLGTLINPLSNTLGYAESIVLVSIIATLLLSIAIAVLGAHLIYKTKGNFLAWMVVMSFIMLPNGLGNLYYDFGRQDIILVLFIFISIYLLYFPSQIKYTVACTIYFLGILIHEVYIFMAIPIFSFFILRRNAKIGISLFIFISINTILIFLLFSFGKLDISTEQFYTILKDMAIQKNVTISDYFTQGFSVIFTKSLYENFIFFVYEKGEYDYIFTFFTALPLIILTIISMAVFNKSEKILLIFGLLFPLSLSIVAIDIGRWVGISMINVAIITGLILCDSTYINKNEKIEKSLKLLYLPLLFIFSLAITGVTSSPTKSLIKQSINIVKTLIHDTL